MSQNVMSGYPYRHQPSLVIGNCQRRILTNESSNKYNVQFLKGGTKIKKQWLKPACNASHLPFIFYFKIYKWFQINQSATCLVKQGHLQVLYKKLSWIIRRKTPMLELLFKVSTRQCATLSKKAPVSSQLWIRLTYVFSCEFLRNFSEHIFFKTLLVNCF